MASDSGKTQLWVRPLDSVVAQPLNGTDNAAFPFWSPDSRYIAFFADGKLKKIEATGGPAQALSDSSGLARGGSWSKDGVIVFAPDGGSALRRVPAEGGASATATMLNTSRGEYAHRWPSFLPDGRHFLFVAVAQSAPALSLNVASLDSPKVKPLTQVVS